MTSSKKAQDRGVWAQTGVRPCVLASRHVKKFSQDITGLIGSTWKSIFIELDDGKIYRKPLYLMVKTMVSCRFSLNPIHWNINWMENMDGHVTHGWKSWSVGYDLSRWMENDRENGDAPWQISMTSWSIRASQQAFLGAMAPSKWDAEQEKQRDMLREHWLRCLGLEE